ncbi:MAG: pyridoxal-phosphate dependent enzyme [Acidobacteriota bacterium]|nr:pyridoxal-phosphate dependent enzyme [Acidobacteriota bacterium]
MDWPITLTQIQQSRSRMASHIPTTPFRRYPLLESAIGHEIQLFVKHENHCPTNSFKARNGLSFMTALPEADRPRGVVAATRGNHGQGLAWAGGICDVPVTVFVPHGNNPEKNAAMVAFGARLIEAGHDYDESLVAAKDWVRQEGAVLAHSTNDPEIIAGAGTLSLEMYEQQPELDAVVVTVGGGSQAVGAMTVFRALRPSVAVYAAQARQAAAIHDSWHAGEKRETARADTFADGLATRSPYSLTFPALLAGLTDFVTVTEAQAAGGVRLYLSAAHQLAEGAAGVGLAAVRQLTERLAGQRVGLVLSGGNIDRETLKRVLNNDL